MNNNPSNQDNQNNISENTDEPRRIISIMLGREVSQNEYNNYIASQRSEFLRLQAIENPINNHTELQRMEFLRSQAIENQINNGNLEDIVRIEARNNVNNDEENDEENNENNIREDFPDFILRDNFIPQNIRNIIPNIFGRHVNVIPSTIERNNELDLPHFPNYLNGTVVIAIFSHNSHSPENQIVIPNIIVDTNNVVNLNGLDPGIVLGQLHIINNFIETYNRQFTETITELTNMLRETRQIINTFDGNVQPEMLNESQESNSNEMLDEVDLQLIDVHSDSEERTVIDEFFRTSAQNVPEQEIHQENTNEIVSQDDIIPDLEENDEEIIPELSDVMPELEEEQENQVEQGNQMEQENQEEHEEENQEDNQEEDNQEDDEENQEDENQEEDDQEEINSENTNMLIQITNLIVIINNRAPPRDQSISISLDEFSNFSESRLNFMNENQINNFLQNERNKIKMNRPDYIIVNEDLVTNDMLCPISREVMLDPIQLICGHIFDEINMKNWNIRNNSCPICRKNIKVDKKQELKSLKENLNKLTFVIGNPDDRDVLIQDKKNFIDYETFKLLILID